MSDDKAWFEMAQSTIEGSKLSADQKTVLEASFNFEQKQTPPAPATPPPTPAATTPPAAPPIQATAQEFVAEMRKGAAEEINMFYRHAQGSTIYGGTSEVHRSMIAERGLGMPRTRA